MLATASRAMRSPSPPDPATICRSRAIEVLADWVVGRGVDDVLSDMGAFSKELIHEPHLRWLGPEKGVVHMAAGAVINAAWDLRAKRAGQPLWQHLARLEPEELVSLVDFRYLTDALTQGEALEILERARQGRGEREERLLSEGYPAYTTTPGWLGYSDDKLDRLAREAVEQGFTLIKLKVGADVADDVRRMKVARAAVGDGIRIAVDANQRWDVGPAIDWMRALAPYDPYWIEEPTSPDDVLGHAVIRRAIHPIKVATGEHVANRVDIQAAAAGRRRRHRADRCRPRGRRQREPRRPPAGRQATGFRSARTPAESACARWSNTCRCLTMSPSREAGRIASSSTSTISTSISSPRYTWSAAATAPR